MSLQNSAQLQSSSWHWGFPGCSSLPSICHHLASQVSSGTLWLSSIAPLCCSPGCLTRAGGRRHGWRRRSQRFPRLLPAPLIPLPLPESSPPQRGHLEGLTGTIPVSCSLRSTGKSPLGCARESSPSRMHCGAPDAPSPTSFILPFATRTSCPINHTANWQAGSSPITNLPPHPIFGPGIVKLLSKFFLQCFFSSGVPKVFCVLLFSLIVS